MEDKKIHLSEHNLRVLRQSEQDNLRAGRTIGGSRIIIPLIKIAVFLLVVGLILRFLGL